MTLLVYRTQTDLWREEGLALASSDHKRAEALRLLQVALYDSPVKIHVIEKHFERRAKQVLRNQLRQELDQSIGKLREAINDNPDTLIAAERLIGNLTEIQQLCSQNHFTRSID